MGRVCNIHKYISVGSVAAVFLCAPIVMRAQPPSSVPKKVINWTLAAGKNNEIFFAVPQNSVAHRNGEFLKGKSRAQVDGLKTLACHLGDSVLQVDLYEGNARALQMDLIDEIRDENNDPVKAVETEKNGFKFVEVSLTGRSFFLKRQFYRRQTRLYVFTAASRNPNSLVIKDFFDSVVLLNGGVAVSPNLDSKPVEAAKAKMVLPASFIVDGSAITNIEDSVDESAATRRAVIIFQPVPQIPVIDSRFVRTFNQVSVRVLLQADGTIGKAESVTKTSPALEKQAVNAAKGIQFLPAEKNGKPVSTYRTVEFSLAID